MDVVNLEIAIERPCAYCGTPVWRVPLIYGGREMFSKWGCDACSDSSKAQETDARAKAAADKMLRDWEKVCPKLYLQTEIERLPTDLRSVIDSWDYSPKGLGMFGMAGKGKTRTCFKILERWHHRGKSCFAVSSTKFAKHTVDQFADDPKTKWEARFALEKCRTVDLLLMDDLGKNKFTDRAETEFFDVLETRTSNLLPTIWTCNAEGNEFQAMMGKDRAEPIMRRLVEFSDIL